MTSPPLPNMGTYTPTITWGTGTGVDTSAYDDVSSWYLNGPGLVVSNIGRNQLRAYSPPQSPEFALTLTNHDGRFSPGGPLANFLGRGPDVTLDVTWGAEISLNADDISLNNDVYPLNSPGTMRLFDGGAVDMPQSIPRSQATVQVRALGNYALLVDKKPTTTLYESVRTDQAITLILDAIGWPADKRSIDTGDTVLLYWWLDGKTTANTAIEDILAAEGAGGCAYEDGNGVFHFEGRQFRDNNARSLTTQYSFFDGSRRSWVSLNADQISLNDPVVSLNGETLTLFHVVEPAPQYASNPDEVVKTVTATVNVRTPTSTQKVWEYGSALVLTPNQVLDVKVTSSDPFKSAVTPVAATDYTVAAGSLVGVTLLTTSGQTIVSRWVAGASGATINGVTSNGPQVRAISLPVTTSLPITSTVDTTIAAARSRPKDIDLPMWPEIGPSYALDLVNSMALRYQRERHQVTFGVVNIDAEHMRAILNIKISDRVRFFHTHANLNEPYWVEQIHHEIAPGGGHHVLTLGCERVFDLSGGKFDQGQFDFAVFGV
jgi:hypothetical protein